jgi:hypothetical protein
LWAIHYTNFQLLLGILLLQVVVAVVLITVLALVVAVCDQRLLQLAVVVL